MHSLRIFRITSRLTFYSLLSVLISIFLIQFLIIDSYGINNDTSAAKNIEVIDIITLDTSPQCIEYNPQNGNIYVPSNNGIYVINSSNHKISDIISSNISTVDPFTNSKFDSCIEYNPQNYNMYMASHNGIYVINSSNNEISDFLKNQSMRDIAFNEEEGNLYLITKGFNGPTVAYVINGSTHETLGLLSSKHGYFLNGVEYNPGNGYIYLWDGKGPGIDFIKYSKNDTIKENLIKNSQSWSFQRIDNIFYNEYNNTLYISIYPNLNDGIFIANATDNNLIGLMPLNGTFIDMEFNPKNGIIYGVGLDGLYVINPFDNYKIVSKISQNEGFENSIAFNPKNNYLYLINPINNTISVIS